MNISKEEIQKFTKYVNLFHGIKGIYPSGRDVSEEEISLGLKKLFNNKKFKWGGGDSIDRESIRDIIYTEKEITKMYQKFI